MVVMIPKPTAQQSNHIYAIGQPFQPIVIRNYLIFNWPLNNNIGIRLKVWLCLFIAIVIGGPSLYGVVCSIFWINKNYRPNSDRLPPQSYRFTKAFDFIFGLLVLQGDINLLKTDFKFILIIFIDCRKFRKSGTPEKSTIVTWHFNRRLVFGLFRPCNCLQQRPHCLHHGPG